MTDRKAPSNEAIFSRHGNFVVFNQLGVKLELSSEIEDSAYYAWLDQMILNIGTQVKGAEIAEKPQARAEPRVNTGVYYDTVDCRLLKLGAVLRTTCNIKTHAFCAFKMAVDEHSVRRDHRHIFEGQEKTTIQHAPMSAESVAIVQGLLSRTDIEHPGTHLFRAYGIRGSDLTPSVCLERHIRPFFVWLDKKDALRCTMDRAYVSDLRIPSSERQRHIFSEMELPLYPRIEQVVANDPRLLELIEVLAESARKQFGAILTLENKYQRAAKTLGIQQ